MMIIRYWIFNSAPPYTTCFDARVVSNGGQVANPCSGITCQNGGTCGNGVCNCINGFKGTFCEVPAGQTVPPPVTLSPGSLPGGAGKKKKKLIKKKKLTKNNNLFFFLLKIRCCS